MKRKRCSVFAIGVVMCFAVLIAGCGDDDAVAPTPAPTLTSVTPAQGSPLGGTAITLTGTNFIAGATVAVGANAATAVVVVNATTITATTPAGTTGATDVSVTTASGNAGLTAAFSYYNSPTITSISMSTSSNFGGTTITVVGTGFVNNAAGTNTVTIDGTPATGVVVVDDMNLTCVTPAGPAGSAPLALTNANGTATSPYSLSEPILVADGGGNPVPATWDLWAFDPITTSVHMVGPIGFGLTSMDFDPVTGTLFGFTAPGALGPPRQLISINPVTGAGTLIASTLDAGAVNHLLQGASYVGNIMHGVDGPGANLVTVNTTTGLVTILFPGRPLAPGGGFAADATSTNVFYMTADVGPLDSVNIGTGAFTPGPLLNGFSAPGGRVGAAAFHQGTLYGLHAPSPGGGGSPRHILSVNTTTGLLTAVGPVLPSPHASAIASRTR